MCAGCHSDMPETGKMTRTEMCGLGPWRPGYQDQAAGTRAIERRSAACFKPGTVALPSVVGGLGLSLQPPFCSTDPIREWATVWTSAPAKGP